MTDHEEIRQLTARYNLVFDTHDVEEFVACFTEDCTFRFVNSGVVLSGHADVRQAVQNAKSDGRHCTSDFIIEINGDRARQRCQLTELGMDNGRAVVRRYGRYVDELVRVDGAWRFRTRELTNG